MTHTAISLAMIQAALATAAAHHGVPEGQFALDATIPTGVRPQIVDEVRTALGIGPNMDNDRLTTFGDLYNACRGYFRNNFTGEDVRVNAAEGLLQDEPMPAGLGEVPQPVDTPADTPVDPHALAAAEGEGMTAASDDGDTVIWGTDANGQPVDPDNQTPAPAPDPVPDPAPVPPAAPDDKPKHGHGKKR